MLFILLTIMKSIKIWAFLMFMTIITLPGCGETKDLFVWNILWTQLEIWINARDNTISSRKKTAISNSLTAHSQNIYRKNFDLVAELDRATSEDERLNIIDQYISNLSDAIASSSKISEYESSQIEIYKTKAKECESQIKWKNSEFSAAVQNYDFEKSESLMEEIADLRACVARNDVYAKAHASYASVSNSANTLQKRVDYLTENKEKIAKYYEILKPDLLKELYDISKTVESNF